MPGRKATLAPLLALIGGCATVPPLPPPTPELPLAAWEDGESAPAELAPEATRNDPRPAPALAKTAERREPADSAPPATPLAPPSATSSSPIPGSGACLRALGERGVRFHASEPVLGITTPVVLEGSLDGMRFYAPDHRLFVADCRLVLALSEIAPDLRALGVSEVRFSGAYVYKLTHPGRMSMHAYGLAVDLHAFTIGSTTLEVKHAFLRRAGCGAGVPAMNQLACRIRARGVFKEQLGPDDNAAHFDHFHLGLKPLPGELASDLPLPVTPKPHQRAPRVSKRAQSARRRPAR